MSPEELNFDSQGLIPVIVREQTSGQVLMLAYMDLEAVKRTQTSGRAWYWSRSRQQYWRKGDTSGHIQMVRSLVADCDADALLLTVDQVGPACHNGSVSCFDIRLD
ncbi:MAG: phosphoribosyl-AMP cyclohydrolase [Micrococcales bacterium]|nr:phosphoribosyl-AMP cyclohydrolase [Micrococcales bacterium]